MHDQPHHDHHRDQAPHDNPPDAAPVSPPSLSPRLVSRTVIPRRLFPRAKAPPPEATSAEAASPRRGRPSILDDETKQAEILAIIAGGASMFAAASYVGVHVQTLRRLVRTDKHFRQRLEQAEARHELNMVKHIIKASRKQWRAAAWKLERTRPSVYRPQRSDLPTKAGIALMISDWAETVVAAIPGHRLKHRVVEAMKQVLARFFTEDPRRERAAQNPLSRESWDRLH